MEVHFSNEGCVFPPRVAGWVLAIYRLFGGDHASGTYVVTGTYLTSSYLLVIVLYVSFLFGGHARQDGGVLTLV